MKCQHENCCLEAEELFYPDGSSAYFCYEHLGAAGFCLGCGGFYGGVESFHFGDPAHLCDDCRHDPEITGRDDEWEDEWEDERA